ncbi:hypothetical protein HDG40_008060 [Paraburkholderia sp. JPY158]|uniref:Uncharacterized protein n=1 Tax=Paraburkholderia atlantica TaxID=2654982 RepID=A0A7W8QG56_PARAM|nr:hypothetical protein [Paraburkholderia atlantica]
MSGTRITDQQVRLYINKRKHHPQELAAETTGIGVRIYGDRTCPACWSTAPLGAHVRTTTGTRSITATSLAP